jgi:biopolymer transport protein ExbD
MAMKLTAGGNEPTAEMNVTPLIDVMLVLLTVLIITLPIQTHAVKLDFGHGKPSAPPPVVALDVELDGSLLWNGQPVDRAALDADLAAVARQSPQPEIQVHADRLARYDMVAKVLSDAQRLGATRIGIAGDQNGQR